MSNDLLDGERGAHGPQIDPERQKDLSKGLERPDIAEDKFNDSRNELIGEALRDINEIPGLFPDRNEELKLVDRQDGEQSLTIMAVDRDTGKERDLTSKELELVYEKFDEKMNSIYESNKGMDQDLVARAFDLSEARTSESKAPENVPEIGDKKGSGRTTPLENSKELAIAGLSKKEVAIVEKKSDEILKAERFGDVVRNTAAKVREGASQKRQDDIKQLNAAKSSAGAKDIHKREVQIGEYNRTISQCDRIRKNIKGSRLNESRKNAYRTDLTRGLARDFRKDSRDLVDSLRGEDPKVVAAASRYADAKIKLKELEKQPPGENRDKEVETQRNKLARAINRFSPEDKEKIRSISQKLIKTHETREELKGKLKEEIKRLESAKKDAKGKTREEARSIARNLAYCKKMTRVLNSKGKNDRTITGRYINEAKDEAKLSIERYRNRPVQKELLVEKDRIKQRHFQFQKEYEALSQADRIAVDRYLSKPDERVLERMSPAVRDIAIRGERIRYDTKRVKQDLRVLSAEEKIEKKKEQTDRQNALKEATKNVAEKAYRAVNRARDNAKKIKDLKKQIGDLEERMKTIGEQDYDRKQQELNTLKQNLEKLSAKDEKFKKTSESVVFSLLKKSRNEIGRKAKNRLDKMVVKLRDENKEIAQNITAQRLDSLNRGEPPVSPREQTYLENREQIQTILEARSEISNRLSQIGRDANSSIDKIDRSVIDKDTTERAVREDRQKLRKINEEIKSLQISPERQQQLLEGRTIGEGNERDTEGKDEDKKPKTQEEKRFLELLKEKDDTKISLVKNEFLRDCAKVTREYRENKYKPENYEKLNFVRTAIDARQKKAIEKKGKAILRNITKETKEKKEKKAAARAAKNEIKIAIDQLGKIEGALGLGRRHVRTVRELNRDFDVRLQRSRECLETVNSIVGPDSDVETRFVMKALLKDIPITKETAMSFGIIKEKLEYMKNVAAEVKISLSDARDGLATEMASLEARWMELSLDKSLTQEQRVSEISKMVLENDKIPLEDRAPTIEYLEKIKSVSECKNFELSQNILSANIEINQSISDQDMDQGLNVIASRNYVDVLLKTVDPKLEVKSRDQDSPDAVSRHYFSSIMNERDAKISRAGEWENGKLVVSNADYYHLSNQIVDEKIRVLSKACDDIINKFSPEERIIYTKISRVGMPLLEGGLSKNLIMARELDSKISDLVDQKNENTRFAVVRSSQRFVEKAKAREVETYSILNGSYDRFSGAITKERALQMDFDRVFNDTFSAITRKGGLRTLPDASDEIKNAVKFSPFSRSHPNELKTEFKLARENSVIAAVALRDAVYGEGSSGALSPDDADRIYRDVLEKHIQAEFIKGTFNSKYIAGKSDEMLSLNNALVRTDRPQNASILATEYVRTLSSVERTLQENGIKFSYDKLTAGNSLLAEAIHQGAKDPSVFKDPDFYSKFQEERLGRGDFIDKVSKDLYKDAHTLIQRICSMTRLTNNRIDPQREGDANNLITKEQLLRSSAIGKRAARNVLSAQAKLREIGDRWASGGRVTESDLSNIVECRTTINRCAVAIEKKEKADEMIKRFSRGYDLRELSTEDLKAAERRSLSYFRRQRIKVKKDKNLNMLISGLDARISRNRNNFVERVQRNEALRLKTIREELRYRKEQDSDGRKEEELKRYASNFERLPEYKEFKKTIEKIYGDKNAAGKILLAARNKIMTSYNPKTILDEMSGYCRFFESRGIDMTEQRFAVRVAGELITSDYFDQRGQEAVIDRINKYDDFTRENGGLTVRQKEEYNKLQASFDVATRERVEYLRNENRTLSRIRDLLSENRADEPDAANTALIEKMSDMGLTREYAIEKINSIMTMNSEKMEIGQDIIRERELYKAQLNRGDIAYSYNPSFLIARNAISANNPGMLDINIERSSTEQMDIPGQYPLGLSVNEDAVSGLDKLFQSNPNDRSFINAISSL